MRYFWHNKICQVIQFERQLIGIKWIVYLPALVSYVDVDTPLMSGSVWLCILAIVCLLRNRNP